MRPLVVVLAVAALAACGGSETERPGASGAGGATGSAGTGGASGATGAGASASSSSGVGGASPGCEPLPPPAGDVVELGPGQVAELASAVEGAAPGDTIVLLDGTYDLSATPLWIATPGVTLRSQSGRRGQVILDGGYGVGEIVTVAASDVTIADLTIRRAINHPIHVVGTDTADVTGTWIHNVHVLDPGQQGIKINAGGGNTRFTDDGTISCSRVELTDAGRPHVSGCYTGGIDAHRSRGWRVHDSEIVGFWCDDGLSEHGIHFWTGSRDTLVERNRIHDCARGIGFGLGDATDGRTYADDPCPGVANVGHFGGVIRNNFVSSQRPGFDSGISLEKACGTSVLHNTVASTEAPFSSIEWRFAGTTATLTNNLATHELRERDGAAGTLAGNVAQAPASLFVALPSGDLHLVAGAAGAVDQGVAVPAGLADQDIDREPRVAPPDVGADELAP